MAQPQLSRRPGFRMESPLRALTLAVILAGFTAACSKNDTPAAPPAMPPVPVTVLEVQPQTVPLTVEAVGQTEGAKEVEVRARVGGILEKRLYEEGAAVKMGQVLFQIDPVPYQIALTDAKAKADQATREEARLKGLVAEQAVSRKEYDDATSNLAVARANLRQAELNLSYTRVVAPVSGLSGRLNKSEGNLISTADNLLTTVVQVNPVRVRFSLSDNDQAALPGGHLAPGSVTGVELLLSDGSVYPVKGKLNFAASQVDPRLGTQQLRAEFDNPENKVLPGQFVRVRLTAGKRDAAVLVPQSAVLQSDQGKAVMVVGAENKVEPRPVKAGEWLGKDWVILSGLKAGDKVIVDNLMKLRPGAPVAPKKPGEGAPAAGAAAPAAAPAEKATDKAAEKPAEKSAAPAAPATPAAQPANKS